MIAYGSKKFALIEGISLAVRNRCVAVAVVFFLILPALLFGESETSLPEFWIGIVGTHRALQVSFLVLRQIHNSARERIGSPDRTK